MLFFSLLMSVSFMFVATQIACGACVKCLLYDTPGLPPDLILIYILLLLSSTYIFYSYYLVHEAV